MANSASNVDVRVSTSIFALKKLMDLNKEMVQTLLQSATNQTNVQNQGVQTNKATKAVNVSNFKPGKVNILA